MEELLLLQEPGTGEAAGAAALAFGENLQEWEQRGSCSRSRSLLNQSREPGRKSLSYRSVSLVLPADKA